MNDERRSWDPGRPGPSGLLDRSNQLNSTASQDQESRSSDESQSSNTSHSPSPASASPKQTWRSNYKLEFGARPERRRRKEWICSLECKRKNNEVATFKDAQAAEKHVMREHPDPKFNKFVCLKDNCGREKASPQQILDHLGQKEEKGGHRVTVSLEKDENLRAVKTGTGKNSGFFGTRIPSPGTSASPTSHHFQIHDLLHLQIHQ